MQDDNTQLVIIGWFKMHFLVPAVGFSVAKVSAHHVYRQAGQIPLGHQSVLVGDVQAFLGEGLDDGVVTQ